MGLAEPKSSLYERIHEFHDAAPLPRDTRAIPRGARRRKRRPAVVKLLHRYIFCSVGAAALAGMGLFAFVLVTASAVKDVIERIASGQLSVDVALQMIALLIPFTLSFAAPMGLLIGILVVLGRMSAQNEIVAIKSAGISLWRISLSIVALGLIGVGSCAYINNYYAPIARTHYLKMLSDIVHDAPLRFIVPGRFVKDFPGYVLYVGERDGGKLHNVWVWVTGPDGKVLKFLQARRGNITYDPVKNALIMDVYDATGESRSAASPDDVSVMTPQAVLDHALFILPMGKLMAADTTNVVPQKMSNMSMDELLVARREAGRRLDAAKPGSRDWNEARMTRTRASYYISRNFSFAYSALALAMIAIPLGIRVGRQETYANMAVAVALGMTYFFLVSVIGMLERVPAAHPEILIWAPNVAFQILAFVLMIRANRH